MVYMSLVYSRAPWSQVTKKFELNEEGEAGLYDYQNKYHTSTQAIVLGLVCCVVDFSEFFYVAVSKLQGKRLTSPRWRPFIDAMNAHTNNTFWVQGSGFKGLLPLIALLFLLSRIIPGCYRNFKEL